MSFILTLDAGTTGIKCAAFTREGDCMASAVAAYQTRYPTLGWAQQRPEEQLDAAVRTIREVLARIPVESQKTRDITGRASDRSHRSPDPS